MPESHVQSEDAAVIVETDPHMVQLGAFVCAGHEVLAPVLGELDRPPE